MSSTLEFPFAWTRREWLVQSSAAVLLATRPVTPPRRGGEPGRAACVAAQAVPLKSGPAETLAQQAVEAARGAGASYADARLTRIVQHRYSFSGSQFDDFGSDVELVGVGVRALVNGYWGFVASPVWAPDEVMRLAREAVAQAKVNAQGTPRAVEMGHYPVATGRWATPIAIDPFTITIEEKQDFIKYWCDCAERQGLHVNTLPSYLNFARQERVVATSDGSCFTQTLYESGGVIILYRDQGGGGQLGLDGLDVAAKGWEIVLDAKIPEQIAALPAKLDAIQAIGGKLSTLGRYTLVCDGETMASLVEQTFGIATQLDRALGYEANAGGTSYIDDPLSMVGHLQVAAPPVTVTANRSAPAQLATVKWDDEGVVPSPCTLVRDGVLVDFQTTREQAAWLAPYYAQANRPVHSHGHAAAEDALSITLQHMPNLALEPAVHSTVGLGDLVANVKDGILVAGGIAQTDHQARNGIIGVGGESGHSYMRQISNGRLGKFLTGGTILFNTMDLWRHVVAVGGPSTRGVVSMTSLDVLWNAAFKVYGRGKGQPPQLTSHSVSGVAATIGNQPLINLSRKA